MCIWNAIFKPGSLSVIVAKSIRTQSANILEDIKLHIQDNEILQELIPSDTKVSWTKEKLVTANGAKILYSSNSVNIRGLQVDYMFADEVATFDNHELFFRDIATRVVSKKGTIAAVSTPLHTSDLLAELMSKPGYFAKYYPALIDEDGNADINGKCIWEAKYPKEYLLKQKDSIGLSNFERNYMCNPRAEAENPFFTLASIEDCYDLSRTFTTEDEDGQIYIGCDFAYATGPTADYDAYVVVEYVGDKAIIRHMERHRGLPIPAKIQRLKDLKRQYSPTRWIMDPNNVGQSIVQQLRTEGFPIEEQSFQSLARRKLLIDMKLLIDNKRLLIPRNLDEPVTVRLTNKLTEELIGFRDVKSKITETRHLISAAAHDDTVMALAMACKGAHTVGRIFDDFIAVGN